MSMRCKIILKGMAELLQEKPNVKCHFILWRILFKGTRFSLIQTEPSEPLRSHAGTQSAQEQPALTHGFVGKTPLSTGVDLSMKIVNPSPVSVIGKYLSNSAASKKNISHTPHDIYIFCESVLLQCRRCKIKFKAQKQYSFYKTNPHTHTRLWLILRT